MLRYYSVHRVYRLMEINLEISVHLVSSGVVQATRMREVHVLVQVTSYDDVISYQRSGRSHMNITFFVGGKRHKLNEKGEWKRVKQKVTIPRS